MRFCFVWEKGVSQFARNFLLRNGLSGFSQKITTKNFSFFVFFRRSFCFLVQKLIAILERFIIASCESFGANVPWFALGYFWLKGASLLKTSVNKFRKCWYSMLFLFGKILFKDYNCKFVKIGKSCFKNVTFLKTSRAIC